MKWMNIYELMAKKVADRPNDLAQVGGDTAVL